MNIGRILFIAIFFLSSSTLLTVTSVLSEVSHQPLTALEENQLQELTIRQQELRQEYQQKLIGLLEEYSVNQEAAGSQQRFETMESELLSMVVPTQFQNLHFQLVTAMDRIKAGTKNAMKDSQVNLEFIIKEYSWLASTLSLFIINNS